MFFLWLKSKWLELRLRLQGTRSIHFSYDWDGINKLIKDKGMEEANKTLIKARHSMVEAILKRKYTEAEPLNDSIGLKPRKVFDYRKNKCDEGNCGCNDEIKNNQKS